MAHDGEMLALGGFELTVVDEHLFVRDNAAAKRDRRACKCPPLTSSSSYTRQIPLYNVLWAEYTGGALTIDYAEDVSKTLLRAAKITILFPPSPADSPDPSDGSGPSDEDRDLDDDPERSALHSQPPQQRAATTAKSASQYTYSARPPISPTALATWAASLLDRSYDAAATRRRRAYVLINPNAGPGGAVRKFDEEVRPIFAAARWELDVVVTQRGGEGMERVQELDIGRYDVVVAVSGDGLAYEVFNGLGKRPDARRALGSVAVVQIPCGSGNAMACNLYGTHRPAAAALGAIKGVPTPMDLVSVTQGETRTLSFLSQALGVVAEADLATEHMRWMGPVRFTLGFLTRFLKQAVYPCDVAVKVEIDDKHDVLDHYSRHRSVTTLNTSGSAEALNSSNSSTSNFAAGSVGVAGPSSSADSASAVDGGGEGLPPLRWGTINDKVPDGWELISYDKMGNFYCGNMAYIMPDSNFFSAACINDGLMDLVTINGDIPALKAIALMTSIESGHFFDSPLVGYRKISAYRITPRDQEDGYISIDGERVPFQPFQCEVHQGLGLVLSRSGGYESPGPRNWERVSTSERLIA